MGILPRIGHDNASRYWNDGLSDEAPAGIGQHLHAKRFQLLDKSRLLSQTIVGSAASNNKGNIIMF